MEVGCSTIRLIELTPANVPPLAGHGSVDVDGLVLPPLLRGYLRLGSWVCDEPAYDPDAEAASFYVLLSLDHMNPRYRRHFFE